MFPSQTWKMSGSLQARVSSKGWPAKRSVSRQRICKPSKPVRNVERVANAIRNSGRCRLREQKFPGLKQSVAAKNVGGLFFPQRVALGIDAHNYSPSILEKVVTAGGELKSFALGAKMLKQLADFKISHMQVQRITDEIGNELRDVRDEKTEQHRTRELKSKQDVPVELACVAIDGGRIQTRRQGQGSGVHNGCWKETKIGCLMRMSGETFEQDPHPELPRCFADKTQVASICEAHSQSPSNQKEMHETPVNVEDTASGGEETSPQAWRPTRLFRTCIATLGNSDHFGKMLAAESQHRGFYEAKRKAFLGDGQAYNWTIQKLWFSDFVPIIDFVHVVEYVYQAAKAIAQTESERWDHYVEWTTRCWQGKASEVMKEWESWLAAQPDVEGSGTEEQASEEKQKSRSLAATDPRKIVQTTLTYFRNNSERMKYPEYRCAGLPTTSSMIESLVKEFNYRVKGTEKFWNRNDAATTKSQVDHPVESILQIRAALLSDDARLHNHLATRPGKSLRNYQSHSP